MAGPHRILHVLPDLRTGGGQLLVLNTSRRVDRERYEIHICYVNPRREMEAAFREAGFEVSCLDHAPHRGLRTFSRMVRLLRRGRFELVQTYTYVDQLFAQPAALLCGIPVVHVLNTVYDYSHNFRRASPVLWLRHTLRSRLERLAVARYVAVSRAVYDSNASHLPDGDRRLTLVPNGIPTERFAVSPGEARLRRLEEELGLKGRSPVLINVARLSNAPKDQRTLVRAMAALRGRLPSAILLLVGEGEDRGLIESEIRGVGVGDRVRLLGERHDIPELLALSDIFVSPSRYEGFGLAVAEAMAAGKPVVVSRIAPHLELVEEGKTGCLVSPGDPDALAGAIERVSSDPSLAAAMGALGRRIARERLDVSTCAQGWEDVYESVLGRRTRAGTG